MTHSIHYYALAFGLLLVAASCSNAKQSTAVRNQAATQQAVDDFETQKTQYLGDIKTRLKESGISDKNIDGALSVFEKANKKAQKAIIEIDEIVRSKGLDFTKLTGEQTQKEIEDYLRMQGWTDVGLSERECKELWLSEKNPSLMDKILYSICRVLPGSE